MFKCIELLTEGCVGVAAGGLVWKGRAVRTDGSSGTSNYFLQALKSPDVMWISLNPSSVHTGIKHSDVFKSGSLFLLGHVLIGTQYKYKRLSHSQKPEWFKKMLSLNHNWIKKCNNSLKNWISCHLFTLVSFQMHKLFFLHATQRRISHARQRFIVHKSIITVIHMMHCTKQNKMHYLNAS